jgi:predicted CoA-binding protein
MPGVSTPEESRSAARAAIGAVMRPRSVAIVGISAKAGSAGRTVLELLDNNKFDGPVHLVGRGAGEITGRKVLDGIDELPEGVDLAVFTLPAAGVREAVEGCVRRKVKAAMIFASGFAEIGDDGSGEQERARRRPSAGRPQLPRPRQFRRRVRGRLPLVAADAAPGAEHHGRDCDRGAERRPRQPSATHVRCPRRAGLVLDLDRQ